MVNRKLASPGRAKIRTLSVQPVPARRAPQRGRTCGDQDARSSVAPRFVRGGTGHGREQHDGRDLNPPAQLKTREATLSRAEHTGDDAARNPRRRPHKTTTAAPSEGQGEGGAQGGPGDSKPRPRARLSLGTDLRAHAGCLQQPHPSQSLRACRRTRPGGGHPPPTKASGPAAAPAQGEGTQGTRRAPEPHVHPTEGPGPCKRPQAAVTQVPTSIEDASYTSHSGSQMLPALQFHLSSAPSPARILARHPKS